MTEITNILVSYLESFASVTPLPLFAFFGAIIEDIIAPIPSPLVMTLAGTLARAKEYDIIQIILLIIIASIGKVISSYILYMIADKVEDIVPQRIWKMMGVSHMQIEKMGERISRGNRDDVILFVLRAIPAIPALPISLACGILKINLRTYLLTTFFGTVVKNVLYFVIGYTGMEALERVGSILESLEKLVQVLMVLSVLGGIAWFIYTKKTNRSIFGKKLH